MLLLIESKANDKTIKTVAEDFANYIKVVVDIDKEILTAGGARHVDGEQLLLARGSKQKNLWGGGLDLETREIDFDSIINIRPAEGNTSREVLDKETRGKMEKIIRKLLL